MRRAADETRERILAAALDLFSERSFEGATTRDIAARAEVTQPLVAMARRRLATGRRQGSSWNSPAAMEDELQAPIVG